METACSPQQYNPREKWCEGGTIILLMAIILLIVFIFSPDPPKIQIDSMVVSPFNVSGGNSPVTANWDIGLSIRNPNKFGLKLYYEPMDLSVYYKTEFLTGTDIKPFGQHAKNQTSLMASSSVFEKRFDDWVSTSMSEDLKSSGSVDFKVTLHGWIHYKYKFWATERAWIEGSCPDVTVRFLSPTTTTATATATATTGTMLGESGSRRCKVEIRVHDQ